MISGRKLRKLQRQRGKVGVRKPQFAAHGTTPLLMSLILLAPALPNGQQLNRPKEVLIVEDQVSAPAVEVVSREFESELTSKYQEPLSFYQESLDTILNPEKTYQSEVRDWYERKYSNVSLTWL